MSTIWAKLSLTQPQKRVLRGLITGATLKSHRYLDGTKVYKLHPLQGEGQLVPNRAISALKRRGLIVSNQKFPAATYVLTERGQSLAQQLSNQPGNPITANRS